MAIPRPYLVGESEDIFGWRWGYAFMPRMPGLQLADPDVLARLSETDRHSIAASLGYCLADMHKIPAATSGTFDVHSGGIQPFSEGWTAWCVSNVRQLLTTSQMHSARTNDADATWVERVIELGRAAIDAPFAPSVILRNFKEANVTVERSGASWSVVGVFDLMESCYGDGEMAVCRQAAHYLEEDESLARTFLGAYCRRRPFRSGAAERLSVYMLLDRLLIWEYYQRPGNILESMKGKSLKAWATPYLEPFSDA